MNVLRYRTNAKPVAFSIKIGGVECSSMSSLLSNFCANDILEYMKKGDDTRMQKWLKRNRKENLVSQFEEVHKRYAESLSKTDGKNPQRIDEKTYLDLIQLFFSDDFENTEVSSLHDVLKSWKDNYSEGSKKVDYLRDYLCETEEGCKKVCEYFKSKQTIGNLFEYYKKRAYSEGCLSLYEKYYEEHPEWVDCEEVFNIASDLYWKEKKPSHLFVVAKLLIERLAKGDNAKVGVGISCLMKVVEQKYDPATKYLKNDNSHADLICQSEEGCKAYFDNKPSAERFKIYFDFCVQNVRKSWSEEDFAKCETLVDDNKKFADNKEVQEEFQKDMFDIASELFWKNQQNARALYYVAQYLMKKFKTGDNRKVADECMQYAAEQLKYQPAVDSWNSSGKANKDLKKGSSK